MMRSPTTEAKRGAPGNPAGCVLILDIYSKSLPVYDYYKKAF
jgi:hypothetical protein